MASTIDPSFITSAPVSKTGMKQQLQIAKDEITQLQDVLLPLKLDKAGGFITGTLAISAATTGPLVTITQTGAGHALVVEDAANPDATPFIIDSAGNVGIGKTPVYPVDILAADNIPIGFFSGASYAVRITSSPSFGGYIEAVAPNNATYQPLLLGGTSIQFTTSGVEKGRLSSNGNWGFGLVSPGYPVTVQADAVTAALRLVGRASDNISTLSFSNNTQSVENAIIQSQPSFLSFQVNNGGALANRFIIPGNGPLTIDGKALQIQRAAEQATTSGSAIDFTGIPAGVRRITIMLDFVSIAASDTINLQLGDSGGIETTGYSGFVGIASGTSTGTISISLATAYSLISGNIIATDSVLGIIELVNQSGNKWAMKAKLGRTGTSQIHESIGFKTLSDVLDRLRIRTDTGVAFDAGSINIMWEF